ncbi:PqiC family protein [Alteromonas gracilis]|uniref:ABC-type transport auxiliary lipoprotein component domain-containing protein n=1 Tax=Alteromonas gracilis TaxID=1479524 RepID=A0ABX5CKY4_9ALTE|nr:ABC-type transport auxiliary lipoprotein family protein [Alteromonas gracilis]PRO68214.1 hypothetical protein C6Y39_14345 [Alteromonas gracilis]
MIMQFITGLAFLRNKASQVSILVVSFLLIQGCTSAPTSLNYYLLHSTDSMPLKQSAAKQIIVLDKITLPDYLKHRGLVYQTSDTNLHISTSHLWAEPVEEGLTKVLSSALADKHISLNRGDQYSKEESTHVSLHIGDFISTYEGEVVLSGQYTISSTTDGTSIHPFKFKASLDSDGFSSSIKAMRNTVTQLAQHLERNL